MKFRFKGPIIIIAAVMLLAGAGALGSIGSSFIDKGDPSRIKPVNPKEVKTIDYPQTDARTYKFLHVPSPIPTPQAQGLFANEQLKSDLKALGFSVQEIMDDVGEKVQPNLAKGYYDFAYLPLSMLVQNWAELDKGEKKGSGNRYVIIASAYLGGTSLLTSPEIFDVGDLNGKTIGIINQAFDQEAALNNLLEERGLSTKGVGGSVEIVRDTAAEMFNSLLEKKVAAVLCSSEYKQRLQAMGFQEAYFWQENSNPNMVLVAREDILAHRPEVVKSILRAHVTETQKILQGQVNLQQITVRYNQYARTLNKKQKSENDLNLKAFTISYAPNRDYLEQALKYLAESKYLAETNPENVVDLKLLNEVLKEQGLNLAS